MKVKPLLTVRHGSEWFRSRPTTARANVARRRALLAEKMHDCRRRRRLAACVRVVLRQRAVQLRHHAAELRMFGADHAMSSGALSRQLWPGWHPGLSCSCSTREPSSVTTEDATFGPFGPVGQRCAIAGNNGTSWLEPAFIRSAPIRRRSDKTSSQRKPPISSRRQPVRMQSRTIRA